MASPLRTVRGKDLQRWYVRRKTVPPRHRASQSTDSEILVYEFHKTWTAIRFLGRFPFVRTDRSDPSVCKENAAS